MKISTSLDRSDPIAMAEASGEFFIQRNKKSVEINLLGKTKIILSIKEANRIGKLLSIDKRHANLR